ncbi:MAG: GH13_11 / GH13 / GH13_13 / CBM48 / GH13_10, partial [uncultured Solirubrobacteraceae bacterium]
GGLARAPVPVGRQLGRRGNQLLAVLRERHQRRALPVRRRRRRDAHPRHRADRLQLALLPARRQARAALRIPGRRPLRAAQRASLQPGQAPDRSLRQGDRGPGAVERGQHAGLRPAGRRRRRRLRARRRGLGAGRAQGGRHRPALRLAGRPAAEDPDARVGDLRGARQGLHQAARGHPGGAARHLRRPGVRPGDRLLQGPRRHRGRAAAGASDRRRVLPQREGPDQLLGLLDDRLPRAPRPVLGVRAPGPAGHRVQGDGQGAAPRRHRGDPRRGLQPHRRGQPPRAHAEPQGRRQRLVLPAGARRPALLHGLHRDGQLAQRGASQRPADDHGLAALLRHRVPRRRLPLRPRLDAGARALRGQPPERVLRRHPPGSGALAGQADRRALGRRAGRLPGRQLPGPVVGVERHLPRHRPRLLARARLGGRLRIAPDRLQRPLRGRRPPPVRVDQLRHRPRRLHPPRPRLLQREAQRGQRGGQQGRHRRQPLLELRRRGPDRRPRDQRAAPAPAAQLPDHPDALPGRAHAARRRRVRPHPARQQQRVVPGQRALVVRLGPRRRGQGAAGLHQAADRPAPGAPGLPPAPVPVGPGHRGLGSARRLVVPDRRAQDGRPRLGRGHAGGRHVPQRRGDHDAGLARRAHRRRLLPDPVQRPPRGRDLHAAQPPLRSALDVRADLQGRWGRVAGPPGRGARGDRRDVALAAGAAEDRV